MYSFSYSPKHISTLFFFSGKMNNPIYFSQDHEVDIEDSLSHLVLDDKEGITPRPGVWDCPINLPSLNSRPLTSLLPSTIKNIRTVEELELGLMSRPPPGLTKPMQQQQPHPPKLEGNFIFDTLALKEQQQLQHNGLTTPRFPPGLGPPVVMPNMRLPPHPSHPSFLQNSRLLPSECLFVKFNCSFITRICNCYLA